MKGKEKMKFKELMKDGHVHTPFCPHGTSDTMEAYVEEAIRLGIKEMSFTEHFPLPDGVCEPKFQAECALLEEAVPKYLEAVEHIKEKYKGRIKINRGFEVDYLEGRETEIEALLSQYGASIEDSLLSTHFVKYDGRFYAIDWKDDVEKLLQKLSIVEMYDLYFNTLIKSIDADLGKYKPKRIGHPSLVHIYQKIWPIDYDDHGLFEIIAQKMKERDYAFDLNVAGLRRENCGEIYPTGRLFETLMRYEVPYVFGSDSHQVDHMKWLLKIQE